MKDSLKWFDYYKRKMKVKLRVMYKRKQIKWDGYYYFALTKNQYEKYLAQTHTGRGRPKKNFLFEKVYMYKIFDECSIMSSNQVAIFRYPMTLPTKFKLYLSTLVTDKAELLYLHNPLTS